MRSIRARRSVCALALGWLLAGCSQELSAPIPTAHPEDATPRRSGKFTFASFGDIRSLDPANVSDGLSVQLLENLFAGLLDYDEHGKITPDLAENWTISDDGTSFRFVLREGVRFHDGEEVTAQDVKRSVERALHPSAPNPYASAFASITGYEPYRAGKVDHLEGVTVSGQYVVTFHLDAPDASFLPLLAMHPLRPVCRSAKNRYEDTWHPCGAGPFKLPAGGWDRGREITLVRHPGYFRPGLPYLDEVHALFHVNFNAQRFKFVGGDLDILRDFLAPDLLKFQADPRWKPYGEYEIEKTVGGIAMNTEMPPFDNVEVRRAIASAIDRDKLRLIRAANLRAADRPVPPSIEGFDPNLRGQHYDYPAALDHMRRAGFAYDPVTKIGGYPHVIPYLVYGQSIDEYLAQVMQQMLAKIGIRIEIRVVNYASFLALRGRRGESPMGPGSWTEDYPEPSTFLEPIFTSQAINDSDSNNWAFYKNPRFDDLVSRAKREVDQGRRQKLYTEAQALLCDEAPWAFTHYYRLYTQWHPYLHDYRPHPLWATDLRKVWLDRAGGAPLARSFFHPKDALATLFDRSSQ